MLERYTHHPSELKKMDTEQMREAFALTNLFKEGVVNLVYSHYDRMVIGGVEPKKEKVVMGNYEPLKSEFFLNAGKLE